jgi:prepilin-type N-terminal cleavage/methylation domain-containing protein
MHILKLKLNRNNNAGYTLVELLVAIAVMGFASGLVSYALSSMLSSNQKLVMEQNRRIEIVRAMETIVQDVEAARIIPVTDIDPENSTKVKGTVVLALQSLDASCPDEQIIYTIKYQDGSDKNLWGPNIIYRYGRIPKYEGIKSDNTKADGKIDCGASPQTTPLADGVSIKNNAKSMVTPTCTAPSATPPASFASLPTLDTKSSDLINGFYACINDQQVSLAIFSKIADSNKSDGSKVITKTFGINQSVTSGLIPDVPTTSSTLCRVPTLQNMSPIEAEKAISNANLIANGIDIDPDDNKVVSQNPLQGNRVPCGMGLVTYTH